MVDLSRSLGVGSGHRAMRERLYDADLALVVTAGPRVRAPRGPRKSLVSWAFNPRCLAVERAHRCGDLCCFC
jgi:hypothetical protein